MEIQKKEFYILLVETNAKDAALTIGVFRKNNLDEYLLHCESAKIAHHYLSTAERFPSLVILDFNSDSESEKDLIRLIKSHEKTKAIPFVVLTDSRDDRRIAEAHLLNASAFLLKPLDNFKLRRIIAFVESAMAKSIKV